MNGNQDDVAAALKVASDAAFATEQAFIANGDQANAVIADDVSQELLQASGAANATAVLKKLSDTAQHEQVVKTLTTKLNAAAQGITADEKTIHTWLSIASNALQLVSKVTAGNIPGAIGNATAIVHLLP